MRHSSILIDKNLEKQINNLLTGTQTISQFIAKATHEKVKRMETRDKYAREALFEKDIEIFTPLVETILKRLGK